MVLLRVYRLLLFSMPLIMLSMLPAEQKIEQKKFYSANPVFEEINPGEGLINQEKKTLLDKAKYFFGIKSQEAPKTTKSLHAQFKRSPQISIIENNNNVKEQLAEYRKKQGLSPSPTKKRAYSKKTYPKELRASTAFELEKEQPYILSPSEKSQSSTEEPVYNNEEPIIYNSVNPFGVYHSK